MAFTTQTFAREGTYGSMRVVHLRELLTNEWFVSCRLFKAEKCWCDDAACPHYYTKTCGYKVSILRTDNSYFDFWLCDSHSDEWTSHANSVNVPTTIHKTSRLLEAKMENEDS